MQGCIIFFGQMLDTGHGASRKKNRNDTFTCFDNILLKSLKRDLVQGECIHFPGRQLSENKVHFKTIEFAPRGDQPQSRNTSLPGQQQKKR